MAVRTVSVELKMKISDFELAAAKAAATTKALAGEFDDLGKTSSKFSTAKPTKEMQNFSRVINSSLKDGKTGFQSIQSAIDDTKTHIANLRHQIRTGSGSDSIFGDLKTAQKDLRRLEGIFKDIGGTIGTEGSQAGRSFMSSFVQSAVQFVPFVSSPVGLAVAGAVVAVAVPIIGGAVAGAVGAGVGLGLIGAAALIQKNDPQIQAAFSTLKDDAVSVFKTATQPLVGTFVDALDLVDVRLKSQGPQFAAIFAAIEPAIKPVVADLLALETGILPGLQRVAEGFSKAVANPAVQASIVELDKSFTALFNEIGNNPQVITDSFVFLNVTLGTTADIINGMVHAGASVDKFFHALFSKSSSSPQLDPFSRQLAQQEAAAKAAAKAAAVGKSIQSMGEHSGTANLATQALGFSVQSLGEHAGKADPALQAVGKSMASMGEHAGTSNLATQAVGFSVKSMGEHASTTNPAMIAVGKSMASMGEHAGTSNLATQALGFSVQSMGEHSGTAMGALTSLTATQKQNTLTTIGELQAFQSLNTTLNTTFDKYMSVDQAAINVKQAQADLNKQLGHGKKSWDENTQAGRDNWSQLLTAIQTDKSAYDARVNLEGATKKNTTAYDNEVESLLAIAKKAGLSKDQIALLRQQFEVLPKKADTKVSAPGLSATKSDAAAYARILANLPSNVHTNVELRYYTTGKPRTGPLAHFASRWGNLYEPAAVGTLRDAQVYSPVNPGRFMIAEPQTKGEAFIPKSGDYGRSMSILSAAAGWYGARVMPSGGAAADGAGVTEFRAAPGDQVAEVLLSLLRPTVRGRYSGSAQLAVGAG